MEEHRLAGRITTCPGARTYCFLDVASVPLYKNKTS